MWQEFATLATALRHIKSQGAPSTLQQVQIERAAKNSKARNGFEFSFEAPTGAVAAKPPPKPTPTTAHTPSVASYVQVLSLSYCGSCCRRLCGVTTKCSQCQRGVHEQCSVVVEGDATRVEVGEEGESGDNRWCFACAYRRH